jgi:hypothetical protein
MNNEKLTTDNRSTELVIDRFPVVRCPFCIFPPAFLNAACRVGSRAESPGSMR